MADQDKSLADRGEIRSILGDEPLTMRAPKPATSNQALKDLGHEEPHPIVQAPLDPRLAFLGSECSDGSSPR